MMVDEETIKTSLLQIFVTFYSFLGFHLRPIRVNDWQSLLRLAWNITIAAITVIAFYCFDPFQAEDESGYRNPNHKPFLPLLLWIDYYLIFPLTYPITIVYVCLQGRRLVRQLDREPLRAVYGHRQTRFLGFAILAIGHLVLVGTHFDHFISWNDKTSVASKVINVITIYCIFFNELFVLYVMHYVQYATYRALRAAADDLEKNSADICVAKKTLQIVRRLASLSVVRQNVFVSLIVTLGIVDIVVNFVASICTITDIAEEAHLLLYYVFIFAYLTHLAWLSDRSEATLRQISTVCAQKFSQITFSSSSSSSSASNIQPYGFVRRSSLETRISRQSLAIRLHRVTLYGSRLRLSLFDLCALDVCFCLQTILCLLNYCLLFMQTK